MKKESIKKTLAVIIAASMLCGLCACTEPKGGDDDKENPNLSQIANPWSDCNTLADAEVVAGFKSPIGEKAYLDHSYDELLPIKEKTLWNTAKSFRAMEGVLEITYSNDKGNDITVRQTKENNTDNDSQKYKYSAEYYFYYEKGIVSYIQKGDSDSNVKLVLISYNGNSYELTSDGCEAFDYNILLNSIVGKSLGKSRPGSYTSGGAVSIKSLKGKYIAENSYECEIKVKGKNTEMQLTKGGKVIASGNIVRVKSNLFMIEGSNIDFTTFSAFENQGLDIHMDGKHLDFFWKEI